MPFNWCQETGGFDSQCFVDAVFVSSCADYIESCARMLTAWRAFREGAIAPLSPSYYTQPACSNNLSKLAHFTVFGRSQCLFRHFYHNEDQCRLARTSAERLPFFQGFPINCSC